MNKICVAVVLALLSSGAWAGWELVASGSGVRSYADKTTIRRSGTTVKMWALIDHDNAQTVAGVLNFSTKSLDDYDCVGERWRTLHYLVFSDHMGAGEIVHTGKVTFEWAPISPGSQGQTLWNIACGTP